MPIPTAQYEPWMRRALEMGAKGLPNPDADDAPVGAVIYGPDEAEILALRQAAQALGMWRLTGCTLVTTLEPGTMSVGAIFLAYVPRLVVVTWDRYDGAVCSLWDVVRNPRLQSLRRSHSRSTQS
ncbi:nucleoside deaminase [Frankia sp. CiP3]|uniref:nucleoside deaminase n=1 Tax=Frankia sp. CiP3 TaxID=2880971 RepID=UPI0027DF5E5B|nr:nucleoside deaminase [Frankia sp. CiP3]